MLVTTGELLDETLQMRRRTVWSDDCAGRDVRRLQLANVLPDPGWSHGWPSITLVNSPFRKWVIPFKKKANFTFPCACKLILARSYQWPAQEESNVGAGNSRSPSCQRSYDISTSMRPVISVRNDIWWQYRGVRARVRLCAELAPSPLIGRAG